MRRGSKWKSLKGPGLPDDSIESTRYLHPGILDGINEVYKMSPEWPIRWLQCDLPAVSRVVNYSSPAWSTRWLQSGLPDAYTVASQMFQEWSTRQLQSGLPDVLILVYQMFLLFSVSSTDVLRMVYQVYRCSRLGSPARPMKEISESV